MTTVVHTDQRVDYGPSAFERVRASTQPLLVDGKFFAASGTRFRFHGVTYGTFGQRADGALFPACGQMRRDLEAMADAGFTVVRTYTPPPEDLLEIAGEVGMRVFAGVFFPDWRYLIGASRRDTARILAEARRVVHAAAARLRGNNDVAAVCLGNEVPGDALRWVGTKTVARAIAELADVVHEVDDNRLVTYANYPTTEYLPLECLDFLTFNVFLEQKADFRRYLTRLQNIAGDRPLVLGEIGLHVGSDDDEQRQADFIDWQLETALERGVAGSCLYSWTDEWSVANVPVEGWRFGVTRVDRSPRPALDVAQRWSRMRVADLRDEWPKMSVVICAYNAAATLDECLLHTTALDYPALEIIVVDDGSTDETPNIASRYQGVSIISIPHAGLSAARNAGLAVATGELVAYLDADAFPSPEWPYYLVLGFDSRSVGAAGGPNVPPPDDPIGAHRVARAPGGPVHVLVSDDRAEHVPGCNMVFWREVLLEVGGFDPVYRTAGDDVDVCWKVLDRGWEIGFHPAALVWHHRRPGLRPYLRQQLGYGRSEALVEARHPDRFTPTGTARWRGRIYNPLLAARGTQRIYRGIFGSAPFQSVYQAGGHALDLLHQLGVPGAVVSLFTLLLVPFNGWFAIPAAVAAAFLVSLFLVDTSMATPPRSLRYGRFRFKTSVAAHHLLQPVVRTWGRVRSRPLARSDVQRPRSLPAPVTEPQPGILLFPASISREEFATAVVGHLRNAGHRVVVPTGWEPFDARLIASAFIFGDVITTAHPIGSIQLRVMKRLRLRRAIAAAALAAALAPLHLSAALAVVVATVGSALIGVSRTGRRLRRQLKRAAG